MLEIAEKLFKKRKKISFSIRGTTDSWHLDNTMKGIIPSGGGWWHEPINASSGEELLAALRKSLPLVYTYGINATRERGDMIDANLEPVIQILKVNASTNTRKVLPPDKIIAGVLVEPEELREHGLKLHVASNEKNELYLSKILQKLLELYKVR